MGLGMWTDRRRLLGTSGCSTPAALMPGSSHGYLPASKRVQDTGFLLVSGLQLRRAPWGGLLADPAFFTLNSALLLLRLSGYRVTSQGLVSTE